MNCSNCGRAMNPDMQFCPGCGRPAPAGPAVATIERPALCTKCGAELQDGVAFCTSCGASRPATRGADPATNQPPQAQPAAVFCVKCGSTFDASSAFCTKCGATRQSPGIQMTNVEARAKNALLLETIGGYFGFLGLGHIYGGRALVGILLMIGWWIGLAIIGAIAATIIGLVIAVPAFFGIPYLSGKQAREYIQNNRT